MLQEKGKGNRKKIEKEKNLGAEFVAVSGSRRGTQLRQLCPIS
jgi:hypothetical protein